MVGTKLHSATHVPIRAWEIGTRVTQIKSSEWCPQLHRSEIDRVRTKNAPILDGRSGDKQNYPKTDGKGKQEREREREKEARLQEKRRGRSAWVGRR
jgi:hypothetical protein